jgi:hypothetical protein
MRHISYSWNLIRGLASDESVRQLRDKRKKPSLKTTRLSYTCKAGKHSLCTAMKCECKCGHYQG